MKFTILLSVFAMIFIAGCVSNPMTINSTTNNSAAVATGDHVSVNYTGKLQDGTIFDSSSGRAPLEFDAGSGQMIKGFDAAVIGMHEDDEKTVTLPPEEAYGMPNPNLIVNISIKNVPNGTKAGDTLYSASGQPVRVIAVTNETVTVDANHPLAGKTLVFDIKILKIVKKS